MENVKVAPSPLWMQYRLNSLGVNPINNLVDVTNYVLCELGQPMHAYDADLLGDTIVVRAARKGESILALNGEKYSLSEEDIVIADAHKPVGIAGIIGGNDTAIRAPPRSASFWKQRLFPRRTCASRLRGSSFARTLPCALKKARTRKTPSALWPAPLSC